MASINRRDFFKAVGVSGATGLVACDPMVPIEQVLPYVVQPDQILPGVPTFFSTACEGCSASCGVVARNREGSIINLQGNADTPINGDGLCPRGQAGLLELYDPDRLRWPQRGNGSDGTWDEVHAELGRKVAANAGKGGVRWLGRYRTGSMAGLISDFVQGAGGTAVHWEPFGYEALATATQAAFGVAGLPRYVLDDAQTIVSFGADWLHTWLSPVDHARGWGVARDAHHGHAVAEFVAIEPRISNTSARADTWWATTPGTEVHAALALLKLVSDKVQTPDAVRAYLATIDAAKHANLAGVAVAKLDALAAKLIAHPSVVFPGGVATAGAHSGQLALATLLINALAGNLGRTVRLDNNRGQVDSWADVEALLDECREGRVSLLFIDSLDPGFNLPTEVDVAGALAAVGTVVMFTNQTPEVVPNSAWLLPTGSAYENWGDAEPVAGLHVLQQAVVEKVYDTLSLGDVLLEVARKAGLKEPSALAAAAQAEQAAAGDDDPPDDAKPVVAGQAAHHAFEAWDYHRYVSGRWFADLYPQAGTTQDFQSWWAECQQRGGWWQDTPAAVPSVQASLPKPPASPLAKDGEIGLLVFPSILLYDGRDANKSWLQEVPDPLSGYSWGTWVELSPKRAASLDVTEADTVKVSTDASSIVAGVRISKGMRDDTVAVVAGNGHVAGGRYAKGRGANPIKLLGAAKDAWSGAFSWQTPASVTLRRAGHDNPLTQLKGSEDMDGRPVALVANVDKVLADKGGKRADLVEILRIPEDPRLVEAGLHDMYPEPEHPNYRFAMSIDLDACTGCGACEVACYAENNVSVVGPKQQKRGRHMGWIRLDRFWEGEGEHPDVRFAPVMCQQCSHAPCEGVCPVVATYHNLDGLNAMIYNRCVGTRYCSNNCPYSARRFNWHTFRWPSAYKPMLNPDVTTREMGVMEKCTFCQQRLRYAKSALRPTGEKISAESLHHMTACAQACPSNAITFGNLKDSESPIAKLWQDPRSYDLFGELNTKPGVNYMGKLTFQEVGGGHHGGGHGDSDSHTDGGDAGGHH